MTSLTGLAALPQVPDSALPRDVREGSQADRTAYRAALGFERMLVAQLLESATRGSSLASGPHAAVARDALADALVAGGGLGLAARLHAEGRREDPS